MRITGISTIDHAPQVAAEWLNELTEDLEWGDDKSRAYLLLRTTMHTIRDFLSVDEAVDLSAQLPLLIRGMYFDGWNPSGCPVEKRSKQAFMDRVSDSFSKYPLEDTERAVTAVFDLLRRHVSAGEIEQVAGSLKKPLRELWT